MAISTPYSNWKNSLAQSSASKQANNMAMQRAGSVNIFSGGPAGGGLTNTNMAALYGAAMLYNTSGNKYQTGQRVRCHLQFEANIPQGSFGQIVAVSGTQVYIDWQVGPGIFRTQLPEQICDQCLVIENGVDVAAETLKKKAAEEEANREIDFKQLDKLVIGEDVREEIVSVLKQHKHSKKMFEDWGLGEMIEYGRGMTFMFYGPPGTGKTWGAKCIAKALGKEIISIGAAEIQTSEPGGANRNIQNAFASAKSEKKILFIDECDSLITNRAAVGIIIGGEINTLLTEIEKFEGVCILATNRIDTLDEALERRISLIVEFPEPDYAQRRKIWEKMIPGKMPRNAEVTYDWLAEYSLTGGQIKNCLLQAARLALAVEAEEVSKKHFESAIDRVQKSKNLMGTASLYHQAKYRDDFGVSSGTKDKVPDINIIPEKVMAEAEPVTEAEPVVEAQPVKEAATV